jgi:hypothetical protein
MSPKPKISAFINILWNLITTVHSLGSASVQPLCNKRGDRCKETLKTLTFFFISCHIRTALVQIERVLIPFISIY